MADEEKRYAVRDIFDTIQGEGSRSGTRAVFIRFAGCNMWNGNPRDRGKGKGACARWCDTDFQVSSSVKMTAHEICKKVNELWPEEEHPSLAERDVIAERWVVLTGGEPMLQIDNKLIEELRDWGFCIAVETNGTVWPSGIAMLEPWFDHICVSPKLTSKGQMPELEIRDAHELKVVLPGGPGAPGTGLCWTEDMLLELDEIGSWQAKYVQPQDPIETKIVEVSHLRGGYVAPLQLDESVKRCIEWVKAHPDWRLGIQQHKVLNIP